MRALAKAVEESALGRVANRRTTRIGACAEFEPDDGEQTSDVADRRVALHSPLDAAETGQGNPRRPGDAGLTQAAGQPRLVQFITYGRQDRCCTPGPDISGTLP